ncbi:uncharacterized protein [Primulina huaijiensis]|uniref:uncharacterized protein n=1 Tax=Primulina huaijiensis TaxID=1492673 RepID=UPI003CC76BA9
MSRIKYSRSKYLADPMVNADDGSETNTEVDNLNKMFIHPCKRCAGKNHWRCLPSEIFFEILLRLPAHVIHDVITHVCIAWNLIISTKKFICNHLQNSTPGIIIMENLKPTNGIYVEIRQGCLEICKFDCRDFYLRGSSVNGLVLAFTGDKGDHLGNKGDHHVLSIINPLTKQHEPLPYDSSVVLRTTLAFAEAAMKYKAVRSFFRYSRSGISVLTIGVDNVWRHLDVQHLSKLGRETLFYYPFATYGYVHWIGESRVVTLNLDTEIIYEFVQTVYDPFMSVPLAMGRNLSCCRLSKLQESLGYLMEVMEMNPETGEWTKLLSSDLKPLSDRFKGLKSVELFGVLAGGEVFLFGISGSEKLWAAYNVRTREIQSFQFEKSARKCHPTAHVNTMIWYE